MSANGDQTTNFKFTGDASGVTAAAKQTGEALKSVGDASKGMTATTVAQGVLMADAVKKMASEIVSFAKDALSAFTGSASSVRMLQRTLGGTAEDMSHLKFAANELSVSADTLSRSSVILFGHLMKNDDVAKRLGVSMYDASGQMKPTTQLLGEIGDQLNRMSDAQQRATLVREAFGRQGVALLPVLQQGSKGLAEFAAEADKLGVTMSQKDLDASKQFSLAVNSMKASFEGVGISIGRAVLPAMKLFADSVKGAVMWVRNLWSDAGIASGVFKVLASVVGALAGAIVVVVAAVKGWAIAQKILKAEMWTFPATWITIGVIALGAAFIALIKNFPVVGDALIVVGRVIGTGLGWGVSIALKAIKAVVDGMSWMVDKGLAVAGFMASLADSIAGFFGFDTGLSDQVNAVRNGLKDMTGTIDKALSSWAETAKDKGGDIGQNLVSGMVKAIRNLHMPSMGELMGGGGGGGDFSPDFTTGGAGGVKAKKNAVQEFFKQLIESARAGLNELRQNAIDARKALADTAKGVAKAIADSFSLTEISDSSFAAENGIDRLQASFGRRLEAMGQFVRNLRKLIGLGLPTPMLIDMVNAGVDKGGPAAQLLADNPQAIADFRDIQAQIDAQSSQLGQMIGQVQYGGAVAATTGAAQAGQSQFAGYLGAAQQSGYSPTAEDMSAASGNVTNEITVNVAQTQASPEEIAAAISWAQKSASRVPSSRRRAAAVPIRKMSTFKAIGV